MGGLNSSADSNSFFFVDERSIDTVRANSRRMVRLGGRVYRIFFLHRRGINVVIFHRRCQVSLTKMREM